MSDLDVVPGSNPGVISVPTTVHINLVDLTREGHRLTFNYVDILQVLHYVYISGWEKMYKK